MSALTLPQLLPHVLDTWTAVLDQRQRDLLLPLFHGWLFAHGRRTATAWFRAGDIAQEFRRAYCLLGTLGHRVEIFATVLFHRLCLVLDPGPRWLFALDDSPTQRYGPCVEGAGLHHNPTPGPAGQKFVYGQVWVTVAWVLRHPRWHTLALPLRAALYIRQDNLPAIPPDHRPPFRTKLQLAAEQIHWLGEDLKGTDKPIWMVVDGFYAKRPVLREAKASHVVLIGRLRKDAGLRSVPPAVPAGQRSHGRPRIYGTKRLSLAKRAGQARGWETVTCWQYQQRRTKKIKTFLATWKPAGGVIRVVLVQERDGWVAFFSTDPQASAVDILEAAAGRTSIEQVFHDVKEVDGAGQQQLRYWRANVGAFNWNLWCHTLVECWAWLRSEAELCDRSGSPWDKEERRPSHADKRKALQWEWLQQEYQEGMPGGGEAEKSHTWLERLRVLLL
jgi:Transposase DDE domain